MQIKELRYLSGSAYCCVPIMDYLDSFTPFIHPIIDSNGRVETDRTPGKSETSGPRRLKLPQQFCVF